MMDHFVDDGGWSWVKPPCKTCGFSDQDGDCGLSDRDYDDCYNHGYAGFEPIGLKEDDKNDEA